MTEIIIPDPGAEAADAELAAQRRITKAFIDRRPVTLTLTPRTKGKTPTGGFKWTAGAPREPQVFTMIEGNGLAASPTPTVTLDGVERSVEFELLGEFDATIQRFDTFTHQGKDWEVVDLYYDNGYEIRAMVSGRG